MAGNIERFEKAMNQGHNAAWDQTWEKAAEFYQQALDEIPDHPKALTSLGLALFELRKYPEAMGFYQRAAGMTPGDPIPFEKISQILELTGKSDQAVEAFMRTAELYIKNKDINKAINMWEHVASLRPEHMSAHSRLALIFERLGRKQEAVQEYLAIASMLQSSGDMQKAFQAVNHAAQIAPQSPEAQSALNMVKTGRPLPKPGQTRPKQTAPLVVSGVQAPSSLEIQTTQSQMDPVQEAQQKALSELAALLFEGTEEEADSEPKGLKALVRGLSDLIPGQVDQTKIMLHLSQVVELQTNKKEDQAAEELERAINAGVDLPAAYYDLGALSIQSGRLESGVRHLQRSANYPEFSLGARLLMGSTYLKMGRVRDAATELLEALKIADVRIVPSSQAEELAQLYDPIVESQAHQPENEATARLCQNVLDMLYQKDWKERLEKARQQLPIPAGDTPLPLAEIILQTGGSQIIDALTKIQTLSHEGKGRTAMEETFHSLSLAPTYLPLHLTMGDLLLQQGLASEAVEKLMTVARCYTIRGESGRAIGIYHRIVDLSPTDMEARSRLITLLTSIGQVEEAVNEYLRMADTYLSLADMNMFRQTVNQAAQLAQQSGVSRGLKARVLSRVADVYMQSLDWKQALRTYEQLRALQPEDEATRQTLIDLNFRLNQVPQAVAEIGKYAAYLIEHRTPEKARIFLESMVEAHPEQPMILRQLAEVDRQLGLFEASIKALDEAGELFLRSGNRTAAKECIVAILALNPANATQYQQLLAQIKGE